MTTANVRRVTMSWEELATALRLNGKVMSITLAKPKQVLLDLERRPVETPQPRERRAS